MGSNYIRVPILYTIFILIYLFSLSPLISIKSNFYQYGDYLFPVLGILVLLSVFFVRPIKKFLYTHLKIKESFRINNLLISAIALIILAVSYKWFILIDPFAPQSVKNALLYNFTIEHSLVMTISMITIGPLWEEIYFRGIMILYAKNQVPTWLCILLSIAFFAYLHSNYPLFGILLAIVFTAVLFLTGSLFQAFFIHVIWNAYYLIFIIS